MKLMSLVLGFRVYTGLGFRVHLSRAGVRIMLGILVAVDLGGRSTLSFMVNTAALLIWN